MGHRGHRKRRRGNSDAWWRRQYGGMPVWGLSAAVAVLAVVAVAFALQPRESVTAAPQISPRETFSFETPTAERKPVAWFIGDSYTTGAKATDSKYRWTTVASREFGWLENNEGRGGTGYTSESTTCGGGDCPPYSKIFGSLSGEPDIIVVSGGRNDRDDLDAFREGVAATAEAATTKFPEADVYFCTPLWDDDPTPELIAEKRAIILEEAPEHGVTVLDIGQPLEGRDDLIAADGFHPNDKGYAAVADAFVEAFTSATEVG